jgi:hypothetical protein
LFASIFIKVGYNFLFMIKSTGLLAQ